MYKSVHNCKSMKKVDVKLTDEQKKLKAKLEYGDITYLTKTLNMSRMTIWNTLNGKRQSDYVWNALQQLIDNREVQRNQVITKINRQ